MKHPAQTAQPQRKPKAVRVPFIPHWQRMRDEFEDPPKPAPATVEKLVVSGGDAEN